MKKPVTTFLILLIMFPPILFGKDDKKYDPTTLVFPSFLHTLGVRKATKMHFMIFTKNKVKVRNPQGLVVARLKSWEDRNNTKDDDEVTGYGINSGENVIVYNRSMTSLGIYGINEVEEKSLNYPTGVAANELGDVYVADTGNHRIVRLVNPKRKLQFVHAIGGKGALPGQFNAPQGVALDSRGMVYVSDTGNHRIQIIRRDDMLHMWFGDQGVKDGEIWHPTGIAVTDSDEPWSYYKDSYIALIDLDHTRIQKFTLDGKFLRAIRLKDFGFSTGYLAYPAIDYFSNIWVTDTANHCIHKFDRNLNYLTSFGRKGTGDKEFMEPRGIAIYKRFGQLFVAEKESAQYYWIGTDIFNFKGEWNSKKSVIVLKFFLTEPSFLTLNVESSKGDLKARVLKKRKYFSGPQKIYLKSNWTQVPKTKIENTDNFGNGTSAKSNPVPKGDYIFKLTVEPTYSSYKKFLKNVEAVVSVD